VPRDTSDTHVYTHSSPRLPLEQVVCVRYSRFGVQAAPEFADTGCIPPPQSKARYVLDSLIFRVINSVSYRFSLGEGMRQSIGRSVTRSVPVERGVQSALPMRSGGIRLQQGICLLFRRILHSPITLDSQRSTLSCTILIAERTQQDQDDILMSAFPSRSNRVQLGYIASGPPTTPQHSVPEKSAKFHQVEWTASSRNSPHSYPSFLLVAGSIETALRRTWGVVETSQTREGQIQLNHNTSNKNVWKAQLVLCERSHGLDSGQGLNHSYVRKIPCLGFFDTDEQI